MCKSGAKVAFPSTLLHLVSTTTCTLPRPAHTHCLSTPHHTTPHHTTPQLNKEMSTSTSPGKLSSFLVRSFSLTHAHAYTPISPIIPHHIITYHIISYHIVLYHIISYQVCGSLLRSSVRTCPPSWMRSLLCWRGTSPPNRYIGPRTLSLSLMIDVLCVHV